jgi:hypothetical protein
MVPIVWIFPHLAAPVSTAATVMAASIPLLRRSRLGSQQVQSAAEPGPTDNEATGRSASP